VLVTKAIGAVAGSPVYFYSSCSAHLTSLRWLATVHHFESGFDKNDRLLGASAHQGRVEILQVLAVQGEMPSRTDSLSLLSHAPRGPCMQLSSLQMQRTGPAKYC
jgi:hypothetical protein